jgi:hypothetical protein
VLTPAEIEQLAEIERHLERDRWWLRVRLSPPVGALLVAGGIAALPLAAYTGWLWVGLVGFIAAYAGIVLSWPWRNVPTAGAGKLWMWAPLLLLGTFSSQGPVLPSLMVFAFLWTFSLRSVTRAAGLNSSGTAGQA